MPEGITSSSWPRVEVYGDRVRVVVEEDRGYSWEGLRESLRSCGLGRVSDELEAKVRGLLEAYSGLLEAALARDLYDIVKPRLDGRGFNFGEIVGVYAFSLTDGTEVVLEVIPKVGWEAYGKMVGEVLEIPVVLGSRGVLKPVLSSVTFQALYSPLSYSLLLLDLTCEVLSAPLPRRVEEYRVVSEDSAGRPAYHDTYVLRSKGYPLGVFRRVRVGAACAPLMLLAVFHERLARDLEELGRVLEDRYRGNLEVVEGLLRELDTLVLAHRVLLWTTVLRDHYLAYLRLRPSDSQLVGEAYRQAGFSSLLKAVVGLYVEYLSRAALLHELAEGRLNPVASSKVYELWVLSRLLSYLKGTVGDGRLVKEEASDLYLVVGANGVRVYYNKPLEAPITTKIVGSELRPDFVVESTKSRVVLDAKYKREIGREDVERLITYIVEYARPVNGKLYGSLLTLVDAGVRARAAARDSYLGLNIEVEVNAVDPRQSAEEVASTIGRVLGRLVRGPGSVHRHLPR